MTTPVTAPATETPAAPAALPSKFQQAFQMATGTAPAPGETPPAAPAGDADLKAARDQAEYLTRQRALTAANKRAEAAEAKAKGYEALDAKDPKAALKLLRERGYTMEMLAKASVEDDEPVEDEATKKLRELEERLASKEREDQEREAAGVRAQNVQALSEMLKSQAEKYPSLSSFARAPQVLADRWAAYVKENGEPDDPAEHVAIVEKIASDFHTAVSNDVANILSSDHALKAYLTRPDVQSRALSILNATQSAGPASEKGTGKGKGAPVIPSTATADNGARTMSPQTHKDKYAAALGLLKT